MDVGEALYRGISGRSAGTEVNSFGAALRYLVGGSSVSAAARDLDVPRSTLRGWLAGRTPRAGRAEELIEEARREQRRDRLAEGRENRLREKGVDGMRMTGTIDPSVVGAEPEREIHVADYLDDGVMDELIDAYLDGAGPDELAEIFGDAVTGSAFYAAAFDPGSGVTTDITSLRF